MLDSNFVLLYDDDPPASATFYTSLLGRAPVEGVAQAPTAREFGHTFVALDPDGHRLRVFALGDPPAA